MCCSRLRAKTISTLHIRLLNICNNIFLNNRCQGTPSPPVATIGRLLGSVQTQDTDFHGSRRQDAFISLRILTKKQSTLSIPHCHPFVIAPLEILAYSPPSSSKYSLVSSGPSLLDVHAPLPAFSLESESSPKTYANVLKPGGNCSLSASSRSLTMASTVAVQVSCEVSTPSSSRVWICRQGPSKGFPSTKLCSMGFMGKGTGFTSSGRSE